tara:strand:+ start:254 stop:451 length:198 start_codon:yes stop_codon:yes gene_type:complete
LGDEGSDELLAELRVPIASISQGGKILRSDYLLAAARQAVAAKGNLGDVTEWAGRLADQTATPDD